MAKPLGSLWVIHPAVLNGGDDVDCARAVSIRGDITERRRLKRIPV
jgi:hypothetical protein